MSSEEEIYRIFPHYDPKDQKRGREMFAEYLRNTKNPDIAGTVIIDESTYMTIERARAKAMRQMLGGSYLYHCMATPEWQVARTVLASKMLLHVEEDAYDAKGVTPAEIVSALRAELNELIGLMGPGAFLERGEDIYSPRYAQRVYPDVIEVLIRSPAKHVYQKDPKNPRLVRAPISTPLLVIDLMGATLYAYPAARTGPFRAITLAEIAMTPYILKDFVPQKIRLRGMSEYNERIFLRTLDVHGVQGTGYVRETTGGELIRIYDFYPSQTMEPSTSVCKETLDAIVLISKLGIVPMQVILSIYKNGGTVFAELENATKSSLRFAIRRLGSVYLTYKKVKLLGLDKREDDPLLKTVLTTLVDIWGYVIPGIAALIDKGVEIDDIINACHKIAVVFKELHTNKALTGRDSLERLILVRLAEKGVVTASPLNPNYYELNAAKSIYVDYLFRLTSGF